MQTDPDLPLKALATLLNRSYSWVKDWAKRLRAAHPENQNALHSRSRARQTPAFVWNPLVVRRVEHIRLFPPEGLQRTPGPKAILYYLSKDEQLRAQGCRLPRSTRTIWKFLHQLGLLTQEPVRKHETLPLCQPLEEVQVDFKDATTVRPDPSGEGKQQHMVEICNVVDAGTSILLSAQVHDDFHTATALEAVIQFLREQGRPARMSFDHDPRWVGGSTGWDFPSASNAFCLRLGSKCVCALHQP